MITLNGNRADVDFTDYFCCAMDKKSDASWGTPDGNGIPRDWRSRGPARDKAGARITKAGQSAMVPTESRRSSRKRESHAVSDSGDAVLTDIHNPSANASSCSSALAT